MQKLIPVLFFRLRGNRATLTMVVVSLLSLSPATPPPPNLSPHVIRIAFLGSNLGSFSRGGGNLIRAQAKTPVYYGRGWQAVAVNLIITIVVQQSIKSPEFKHL